MQKFLLVLLLLPLFTLAQGFPATNSKQAVVKKFELSYIDNYQWLEDVESKDVNDWVDLQNHYADSVLEISGREYKIASKLKEYNSLSSNPLPSKRGQYYYMNYRKDADLPASLFYRKTLDGTPIEILNPYKITKNKNVTLRGYYPSPRTEYIAYELSHNDNDRNEIRFAEVHASEEREEVLTDVKFSNVAWNKSIGVFYKKNSNKRHFETDSTFQLYYHRLGTAQADDKLVYDATETQSRINFFTQENKLFIIESNRQDGSTTFYSAGLEDDSFEIRKMGESEPRGITYLKYLKGRIYYSSDKYDWGEVRSFDVQNRADDKSVIPQIYTHLLENTYFYPGYILCKYKTATKRYLAVYDADGKFIRKFDAPMGTDFSIKFLNQESNELFVSFYSHTISYQNFKLNLVTGTADSFYNHYIRPTITLFPLDHFVTKSVTYKSRDNKDIPITIIHKKNLVLDGDNPTLLEAYGGFGVVSSPHYDTALLYFLEKGGVYAYPEIRGGGDKGLKWHEAGRQLTKMNTFNDFIDAAEYLIAEKYTSSNRLAITGASQGGLLVGVAMTQRPDLFKVAVPCVGLYDMMRFEAFSAGKFWISEYGDSRNKEHVNYMYGYSPYHKIKDDVNYPITLIMTSENDDRVTPFHSYKFAARLQGRASQKNPVILRTARNAGHAGKRSTYNDRIKTSAEVYSFLLYHLTR